MQMKEFELKASDLAERAAEILVRPVERACVYVTWLLAG